MTDRSAFTDDEWSAFSEAPLWVTLAVVTVGEHGPISMVKEAAASAGPSRSRRSRARRTS